MRCISPFTAKYHGMNITLDTDYPFRETLTFRFTAEDETTVPLTCRFRIPAWCKNPTATVNGKEIALQGDGYASVDHAFAAGDVFVLTFPMDIRITMLNDEDRLGIHPISVFRGPLLYSLPVPEIWSGFPGSPATPLPEGWQWYNVYPVIPPSDLDVYDDMGMRRRLITWNAALAENLSAEEITVTDNGGNDYPWESTPISLSVPGFRAPYSYAPYPQKTLEPYVEKGYAYVDEVMPLTLIPYGCTALRISCFPRAKEEQVQKLKRETK